MMLLDKYGDMIGEFKLEDVIAIHCYDDNSNSIFRMKDKMSKTDKIYEVYHFIKKKSNSIICEKTFLICSESDIKEELDNNFKRKWNTYSNKIKHGILHINNNTIVLGEDRKEIGKASIIKEMGIIQLQNESEEFQIGEKYPFIIKF